MQTSLDFFIYSHFPSIIGNFISENVPFNTISRTEHMCLAVPILLHQLEDAENSVGRKKQQLFEGNRSLDVNFIVETSSLALAVLRPGL
jgi:hypothetical protein